MAKLGETKCPFTYKKMGEPLNTQHLHKIDGPEPGTFPILDASTIVGFEINCLGKYVHWVGSKTLKEELRRSSSSSSGLKDFRKLYGTSTSSAMTDRSGDWVDTEGMVTAEILFHYTKTRCHRAPRT